MHERFKNFDIPREVSNIYQGVIGSSKEAVHGLAKALFEGDPSTSNQPIDQTRYLPHPIDFGVCVELRKMSTHHAACLDHLRCSAIGLGYREDALRKRKEEDRIREGGDIYPAFEEDEKRNEIADKLDPLCEEGWEMLLDRVIDDTLATGQGYIEVSRDSGGEPNGLFWVSSPTIHIAQEPDRGQWFRQTKGGTFVASGGLATQHVPFAPFGKVDETAAYPEPRAWLGNGTSYTPRGPGRPRKADGPRRKLNEIIRFKLPTGLWEQYGAPGYLAAVPYLSLVKEMIQQQSDLFHNRGIPDFLLFLLGITLDESQWTDLKSKLSAKAGAPVSGKAAVFSCSESAEKARAELLKLSDGSQAAETISKLHDAVALSICSAHRVPPLLGGISIAGKQGASNELVQSLILFEKLVVKQVRRMVSRTLRSTLGHPEIGVSSLVDERFEFASIIDQLDMFSLDTLAKSRDEAAKQSDRDFSQGTLNRGRSSSSPTS